MKQIHVTYGFWALVHAYLLCSVNAYADCVTEKLLRGSPATYIGCVTGVDGYYDARDATQIDEASCEGLCSAFLEQMAPMESAEFEEDVEFWWGVPVEGPGLPIPEVIVYVDDKTRTCAVRLDEVRSARAKIGTSGDAYQEFNFTTRYQMRCVGAQIECWSTPGFFNSVQCEQYNTLCGDAYIGVAACE